MGPNETTPSDFTVIKPLIPEDREAIIILMTRKFAQLTEWEMTFLAEILGRKTLPDAQAQILDTLWDEVMTGMRER